MGTFSLQLEEGAKLQTPHTDLKDASKIGSWEKFKLYVVPGHHRIYVIQTMTNHLLTAVDGGGRAAEPVFQTDRTYVNAWEKFNLFKRFQWNFIRVSSGNYARLVNDVIHTDGNNQAIDHSFGFLFYKCGDPVSTENGINYVTAVNGGGQGVGGPANLCLNLARQQRSDNLHVNIRSRLTNGLNCRGALSHQLLAVRGPTSHVALRVADTCQRLCLCSRLSRRLHSSAPNGL